MTTRLSCYRNMRQTRGVRLCFAGDSRMTSCWLLVICIRSSTADQRDAGSHWQCVRVDQLCVQDRTGRRTVDGRVSWSVCVCVCVCDCVLMLMHRLRLIDWFWSSRHCVGTLCWLITVCRLDSLTPVYVAVVSAWFRSSLHSLPCVFRLSFASE